MQWAEVSPVIQFHLIAALLALAAGTIQLVRTKGTKSHRWLGRFWVAVMLLVAVSSFWIQELRDGRYSFIHLISIWTLFTLAMGVWAIRGRRKVGAHAAWMIGTFVGGLLVAGGLAAFGEGRVISRLIAQTPVQATP